MSELYRPLDLFDQLTRNYFDRLDINPTTQALSVPSVDISEQNNCFLLEIEVPGYRKEDIDVQVDNGVLTIHGKRESESTPKNNDDTKPTVIRRERSRGEFTRRFALNNNISASDITAAMKDGVLTLTLPKATASTPTKVAVG